MPPRGGLHPTAVEQARAGPVGSRRWSRRDRTAKRVRFSVGQAGGFGRAWRGCSWTPRAARSGRRVRARGWRAPAASFRSRPAPQSSTGRWYGRRAVPAGRLPLAPPGSRSITATFQVWGGAGAAGQQRAPTWRGAPADRRSETTSPSAPARKRRRRVAGLQPEDRCARQGSRAAAVPKREVLADDQRIAALRGRWIATKLFRREAMDAVPIAENNGERFANGWRAIDDAYARTLHSTSSSPSCQTATPHLEF